jgi:hemerythrin superfamily protein
MAAKKRKSTSKSSARKGNARKTTARKSSARKSAGKRQPSDAIALLRADHQLVQGLFDQFEKTRSDDRKGKLAQQICQELTVHAQIEEEIFYPAAREVLRDEDLLDEATVEHQGAKDLIAQIESSSPGADLFDAKVTVLGEYVKHHVKEEQNELFPKVRKTRLDLKAMGEQLQARKMELMGGSAAKGSRSRAAERQTGSRRSSRQTGGKGTSEGLMAVMARGMGLR